jgi:hypothetical protein
MFYRIIREFNDGRLYYCGGAAAEGASWTAAPESAHHYRSADRSVRVADAYCEDESSIPALEKRRARALDA